MMLNRFFVGAIVILLGGIPGKNAAQNLTSKTFGNGLRITAKDSTFNMKIGLRFQTLLSIEQPLVDNADPYEDMETSFLIRRSRLKFDGFAFSPKLKYKLELGLSNRDIGGANPATNNANRFILDAVIKWNFWKNMVLWAGQTKLPGNRERVISSANLQFVNRSLLNSKYTLDRDAGFQLRNHFYVGKMLFRQIGSISMGEGRNITQPNQGGFDYTLRAEILPFGKFSKKGDYFGSDLAREDSPKLSIAGSWDYNDNAVRQRGQLGEFMGAERNLESYFVDLMFKFKGISVMGEWVNKSSYHPLVYDTLGNATGSFYTGEGLNIQSGYVFSNYWEIAGRYTLIQPEDITGRENITQYTLGINKFIVGHALKVQADVSYTQEGDQESMRYRLQMEVHF